MPFTIQPMPASGVCSSGQKHDARHEQPDKQATTCPTPEREEGRVVRVEANFLRLPLFALDNKQMRKMDGLRCEGTLNRDGETYAFTFFATRNARTYYPGPLARSAHLAILSFATEQGLPLVNPIVFTWRELLGRMGVSVSGRTVREVKNALLATKGLLIESRHALYSKAQGKPLDTGSELNQVVNVYDELEFYGANRQDQTVADVNAVWLSRWYIDNLNALYSGPLDYDLWRRLDHKSAIASRLYEFLFFKFHGGREVLRFNYPTLVKFIPARRERYLSDAKKQLTPALDLLIAAGVLASVRWARSSGGEPQLHLYRGRSLDRPSAGSTPGYELAEEDFVLDQIQNVRLPEWQIVEEYHEQWGHSDYRPSKAELETARQLLAKYGKDPLRQLIPIAVRQMKTRWPDGKSFVAVTRYLDEAVEESSRQQRRQALHEAEIAANAKDREQAAEKARRHAALRALWGTMSDAEREEIRLTVLSKQPASLQKHPHLVERLCLEELGRRRAADAGQA